MNMIVLCVKVFPLIPFSANARTLLAFSLSAGSALHGERFSKMGAFSATNVMRDTLLSAPPILLNVLMFNKRLFYLMGCR